MSMIDYQQPLINEMIDHLPDCLPENVTEIPYSKESSCVGLAYINNVFHVYENNERGITFSDRSFIHFSDAKKQIEKHYDTFKAIIAFFQKDEVYTDDDIEEVGSKVFRVQFIKSVNRKPKQDTKTVSIIDSNSHLLRPTKRSKQKSKEMKLSIRSRNGGKNSLAGQHIACSKLSKNGHSIKVARDNPRKLIDFLNGKKP